MTKNIAQKIPMLFFLIAFSILFAPIYALADSYTHYITFTVTDNSSTARTGVPVLTGMSATSFQNAGYMLASGLDTRMQEGTTNQKYGVATTNISVLIPSLAAGQTRTYKMYMGYLPWQSSFQVIPGTGGYVSTNDTATAEPSSNFTLGISGFVNMGVSDNIVSKAGALQIKTDAATSNITANMISADWVTVLPSTMLSTGSLLAWNAAQLVDGDTATKGFRISNASYTQWQLIDYGVGNTQSLVGWKYFIANGGGTGYSFNVQYSTDNSSWNNAYAAWTLFPDGWVSQTWAPIGAYRYWRAYGGSNNNVFDAQEFQVQYAYPATVAGVTSSGEKTVTMGFTQNLLSNGDFEYGDPPTVWLGVGSGPDRSTTHVKTGTYSCNLTSTGVNETGYQTITPVASYQGKTLTMGTWVWASDATHINLSIYDDITGQTYGSYHPGDSDWHFLTVTKTINAAATLIYVDFWIQAGATTTAWFDGAMLVQAASLPSASTGNFYLTVDSSTTYAWTDNTTAVADTANIWYWGQGNSLPSFNYISENVSGVNVLYYQPNSTILGNLLTDRAGTKNGDITWGANIANDLIVTIGGMTPYLDMDPTTSVTGDPNTIMSATQPVGWFNTGANMPEILKDIGLPTIVQSTAAEIGMDERTMWMWLMIGTATAVGLSVAIFTGSAFVSWLATGAIMGAGWSATVIDGWIVMLMLIIGLMLMYIMKQM